MSNVGTGLGILGIVQIAFVKGGVLLSYIYINSLYERVLFLCGLGVLKTYKL